MADALFFFDFLIEILVDDLNGSVIPIFIELDPASKDIIGVVD